MKCEVDRLSGADSTRAVLGMWPNCTLTMLILGTVGNKKYFLGFFICSYLY